MRKKVFAVLTALVVACAVGVTTFAAVADESTSAQSVGLKAMAQAVVAAGKDDDGVYGKTITGDVFDYALGYGLVESPVTFCPYEDSAGAGILRTTVVYQSNMYYGIWANSQNILRFGSRLMNADNTYSTGQKYQLLVKMTFKKNAALTIANDAFTPPTGSAAWKSSVKFSVYREHNGQIAQLHTIAGNDADMGTENCLGGTFQVQKGTTVYYQMARTDGWATSAALEGLFPTFTADPAEFAVSSTDMIQYAYDNRESAGGGSGTVTLDDGTLTYSVGHGTVSDMQEFDASASNALQTSIKNANGYAAVYAGFGSSQPIIRTDITQDERFIIKLTADCDAAIYLRNNAFVQAANGAATVQLIQSTVQNERTYTDEVFARALSSSALTENEISPEVHLPAGDVLYIVLSGGNANTNIYYRPDFFVQTGSYDSSKVHDFSAIIALDIKKKEAENSVQTAYEALSADDYTPDNYAYIGTLKTAAETAIDNAMSATDIDAAVADYTTAAGKVLTIEATTTAKTAAVARLTDYKGGLDEADYTAENRAKLNTIVENGTAAIQAATPIHAAELDTIVEEYLDLLDAVETLGVTVKSLDMFETVYNGGDTGVALDDNTLTYRLGYGTYKDMQAFDAPADNALQTSIKNANGYAAVYAGFGRSKLIRTDITQNALFVMRVSADCNILLTFKNEAAAQATNGTATLYVVQMTEKDGIEYYAELFTYKFDNGALSRNVIDSKVHLPAGDALYIVLSGGNANTNIYYRPDLFVQTGNYFDAGKVHDFTAAIALADKKNAAFETVDDLTADVDEDNYTESSFEQYLALYERFETAVDNAATEKAIDIALENFKDGFGKILTIAAAQEKRAAYIAQVDAVVNAIAAGTYSDANRAKIDALVTEFKAQIETAENETAMKTLTNVTLGEIARIPKQVEKHGNGCGSSLAGSMAGVAALCMAAAAIVLCKRNGKKESA